MMAGVTLNGTMTGVRWDGMKVRGHTYDNSDSSYSFGSFDLGAISSPKRSERETQELK